MRGIRSFLAALALVGLALPAVAQLQSGAIYGVAIDPSGAVLPGTAVSLTSPVSAPRNTTTGSQGEFRFLNLAPGSYALKLTLSSFEDLTRSGIQVGVGQNVDLRLAMALAGSKARIEVSGAAPVLEPKKTGASTNVPLSELQSIPSARDPWVVLSTVPSVMVDRVNVGGSESGQQSVFAGKGDNGDNTMWNIDGVTITDMSAIGSSPTYYDFDSFEEFQVSTGNSDPKLQTGGIGVNMVTKRGSNDFRFSARAFLTNDKLQGDNLPANIQAINERAIGAGATNPPFPGNRIDKILEFGGELGGPVVKDKLWFWGAWAKNDIKQIAISGVPDNTTLKDTSAKLNAQLGADNQATFFWYNGDKVKIGRSAAITRPPETTWDQSGPTNIFKWEDFHNFGPNFYLSGKFNYVTGGFQLTPQGGRAISVTKDPQSVYHRSYLHYETDRPQYQVAADGNAFATWGNTNHEFKFGFNWRKTPVNSLSSWPGDGTVSDASVPGLTTDTDYGANWVTRDAIKKSTQKSVGAYLGDTITSDRLTVNLGLRFDSQSGHNVGGAVPASAFRPDLLPAINVPDGETIFKWNDASPRAGLTYALGEDRKTLVRASYANYADQLSTGNITFNNPFNGPAEIDYLWVADSNNNGIAEASETDFNIIVGQYYVDPSNPTSTSSVDQISPDLSAPRTHEIVAGLEREVMDNFSIGGNFTWRRRYNDVWSPFRKLDGSIVTAADYIQRTDRANTPNDESVVDLNDITGNARTWYDANLGTAFSYPFMVLRDPDSVAGGGAGRLLTNREGYHTKYAGVEIFATKRLSNKWSMRGSFAVSSWKEFFEGTKGMGDPNSSPSSPNQNSGIAYTVVGTRSGAKADVFLNAKWQFNVNMLYQLPWDLTVAANVYGRQGYPAPLYVQLGNPDPTSTTKQFLIGSADSFRMPNVYTVDFRLGKTIKISQGHSVNFDVDVFNLFNTNKTLQLTRRANTSITSVDPTSTAVVNAFLQAREIVAPRLLRFGLRFSF